MTERRSARSPHRERRAGSGAHRSRLLGAAACMLVFGCHTAIPWRGPTFPDAHQIARRQNQLTFVYFRSWYSVECTDFEESVLKHPDVLAESRALVCCVLDYDWDRPLADKWRLTAVPAFAIVAPNGAVLARDQAPIHRESLLAAMRGAKATLAAGGTLPEPAVESRTR